MQRVGICQHKAPPHFSRTYLNQCIVFMSNKLNKSEKKKSIALIFKLICNCCVLFEIIAQ